MSVSPSRFRSALPEILRFGFVGLLNTATTLLIIWGLMALGAAPYPANLLGYGAGMVISFVLNRNWTFRRREPTRANEVFRFLLASAAAYLLNLAALAGLLAGSVDAYLAQLLAMPVYTASFFLLSKYFVFAADERAALSREN